MSGAMRKRSQPLASIALKALRIAVASGHSAGS